MTKPCGSTAIRLLLDHLGPGSTVIPELDSQDWEMFWIAARDHCLAPYMYRRFANSGSLPLLPEAIAGRFAEASSQNAERNRRLMLILEELRRALLENGIPMLVSKGLPLAQAYYGDLGLRVLYDLDFLIRPADRASALQVARALEYVPFFAADREQRLLWRPREYLWDAEHVSDPNRPCFLEFHTRPWEPGWHGFDMDCRLDLWDGARIEPVSGVPLRVPSEEKLLVHLAVHYTCNLLESNARLMHLVDMSLLLERRGAGLDWDLILNEIEKSRVQSFCFVAFELASALRGLSLPVEARHELRRSSSPAIAGWLSANGLAHAGSMSVHRRDRSLIYFLHWHMAQNLPERAGMLLHSVRSPWHEASGAGRWKSVASRMAQRLNQMARASLASWSPP